MDHLQTGLTWRVEAPAKLNLFLEVLGKRDDGFHEIETLMAAVSIKDTLYFEATREGPIRLTCKWASGMEAYGARHGGGSVFGDLPTERDNLVWRSIELLRQTAGVAAGARIRLLKRIPSAAGLGGASSDAAAALTVANRVWKIDWSLRQLQRLAAQLGSDLPFFVASAWRESPVAVCRGRGERLSSVSDASPLHCVVVRPRFGLSTPSVYRECEVGRPTRSVNTMIDAIRQGHPGQVARCLFNRLEATAFRLEPRLHQVRDCFARLSLLGHAMSGSGTSYFGLCHHRHHAQRCAALLRAADVGLVFTATTYPSRHRLVAPAA